METYDFNHWSGHATKRWVEKANKIAQRHDAECHSHEPDFEPHRGWFITQDQGVPFNAQTATAVMDDLKKEGLWPPEIKKRKYKYQTHQRHPAP